MRIRAPLALSHTLAAALALMAACDQRQGLFITVRPGPGAGAIDHVELFLASDAPLAITTLGTPAEAAAQPQAEPAAAREIYVRDRGAADLLDAKLAGVGDSVTFELQAPSARALPYAAVVGYRDTASGPVAVAQAVLPRGLKIPTELVATITVDLAPAVLRTADPGGDLELWSATGTAGAPGASCAGFGAASDPALTFLVDAADPDCDGFIGGHECDANYYQRTEPPRACAVATSATSCQLGKATCSDGVGAVACTPAGRCLPRALCGCSALDPACLATVQQVVTTCEVTYLRGTRALCPNSLNANFGPGALSCGPATFADMAGVPPATTVTDGPATFVATQAPASCDLAFQPSGAAPDPASPYRTLALVDITLAAGTLQTSGVVEFTYVDNDTCPGDPMLMCQTNASSVATCH